MDTFGRERLAGIQGQCHCHIHELCFKIQFFQKMPILHPFFKGQGLIDQSGNLLVGGPPALKLPVCFNAAGKPPFGR